MEEIRDMIMRLARLIGLTGQGLLMLCGLLVIAQSAQASKIKTGEDLIAAMRKKYAKTWYRNTTFKQVTTDFEKDGTKKVAVWYEAISMPGRLRIDSIQSKMVTESFSLTTRSILSKTASSRTPAR